MSSIITPRTAIGETRQVRGILFATAIVTSLLWGCASAGAVLAAAGAIGHALHLRDAYFDAVRFVSAVTGLSVATIRVWRRRYAYSVRRVGLWLEERVPALRYGLVTVLDPEVSLDPALQYRLEGMIREVNLPEVALRVAVPAYARVAITVLVVAFLLSRAMPLRATDADAGPAPPPAPARGSDLGPLRLVAHITPPTYAHAPSVDLVDPSTISALVGSTISLRGRGSPTVVSMPRDPIAYRFVDGADSRVIALLPKPDEPPTVVLSLPAADTTYRAAPRTIVLEAKATDDIGLADGWFECIVSTGESEGNFKSVTDTIGRVALADVRAGSLRATFTTGALAPGSQLSIRAIARDGNTVTGPGVGSSDTRTIRIARRDEYDSLSVAAAAPPILDKALMSQRMLVMEIEALVKKRKRPVSESVRLAREEERLRQEVDDILNGATGSDSSGEPGEREDVDAAKGGGGAVTSTRERSYFQVAYQAMTDAARSLAVALPDTALPPARRALSALDSARVMNRLYLRGIPPTIVVNTARVRLTGAPGGPTADTAAPGHRPPGPRADSLRARVLRYVEQPSPKSDSLSLLQVAAAAVDTALATALGEAAGARDSVRLRAALLRVRRVAAPPPKVISGFAP